MMETTRIVLEQAAGEVCELTDAINVAMARNPEARAAYARIWGTEWESLPAVGGIAYFDCTTNVRTESTEAGTVR